MARSRSSFDLDRAVAAAAALAPDQEAKKHAPPFEAVPLVSFEIEDPAARTAAPDAGKGASSGGRSAPPSSLEGVELPPSSTTDTGGGPGLRSALPPSVRDADSGPRTPAPLSLGTRPAASAAGPAPSGLEVHASASSGAIAWPAPGALPRLPDLSAIASPLLRCERVAEWIAQVTGASDVFLADAAGLPVAGAAQDETRLAASGWIAAAASALAKALPGAPSATFELHLGEGPFFQLIGLRVRSSTYVVGMICPTPLTPRQAGAIRLACVKVLGEALGGPP
jgi:hypothetical protein